MSQVNAQISNSTFGEPIGGVSVQADFIPNLFFCLGFAFVFGWGVFTVFFSPQRRTLLRFASIGVCLERMLVFSIRMAASFRQDVRESWGLSEYQQVALSIGFLALTQEQLFLTLCTAVLATRDGVAYADWEKLAQKDPFIREKRKEEREKYRKWAGKLDMTITIGQGIQAAGVSLSWEAGSSHYSTFIIKFRLACNLFACAVMLAIFSMLHQLKDVQAINRKALRRLRIAMTVLVIIPLFRASVSMRTATTLSTSPPSALPAKVAFYIFQALPELVACAIVVFTDYRSLCDTGSWGDYPRRRIENGLPPRPGWFNVLHLIFAPWRWPRFLGSWIIRRREKKEQAQSEPSGLFIDDTREKSFRTLSYSRRQSLADLSILSPSHMDAEKQSIRMSIYSRGWSTFGGGLSDTSTDKSESLPPPLITDVNLWRPRMFSSR